MTLLYCTTYTIRREMRPWKGRFEAVLYAGNKLFPSFGKKKEKLKKKFYFWKKFLFLKKVFSKIREHFGSPEGPLRAWVGSHGCGIFNPRYLMGISKKPKYRITACTECIVVLLPMLREIIRPCVVKWLHTEFFIMFSLAGIPSSLATLDSCGKSTSSEASYRPTVRGNWAS